MTRLTTLLGYGAIVIAAIVLELVARRSQGLATLGQAFDVAVRSRPVRWLLVTGWLWVGWHLFARVDWR